METASLTDIKIPTIPEIAPDTETKIPFVFSFKDSVYIYELIFTTRNGKFVSTAEMKDKQWIVTTKNLASGVVLEERTIPAW